MARKLILGIVILALVALAPLSCTEPKSEPEGGSISSLGPLGIRDPDIALEYGILGYLDVTLPPDSPKALSISRGEEANITILLHFVSHIPELTEVEVNIDPKDDPLRMGQCYHIEDAEGKVIKRGVITINDLISYNPSGNITIKAGETLPVTMTIRVPADLPEGIMPASIPLGAVGITADVFVLSDIGKLKVTICG
jgi:hypothetical protein